MTAVVDDLQARINSLYPNEHYDLVVQTDLSTPSNVASSELADLDSGAGSRYVLFSYLHSYVYTIPTMEEITEMFLDELEQEGKDVDHLRSISVFEERQSVFPTDLVILSIILALLIFGMTIYYFYVCGCIGFFFGLILDLYRLLF